MHSSKVPITASAIVIAALALTSCSPRQVDPDEPPGAVELTPELPQATGDVDRVVWALPFGEPVSIDPTLGADWSPQTVFANMCESLLRVTTDFEIAPGVASATKWADDLTLVVTINEGITFWDGSPLTMEDVLYSLEYNMRPESVSGSGYSTVSSVEQTGDWELTIRLSSPSSVMLNALATGAWIFQKEWMEALEGEMGTAEAGLMCTGPFQFESWKSGEEIVMTRYDGYWNDERRAHAEEFVFTFLTDPAALTGALVSGQIDGAYNVPLSGLNALRESDAGTLYFAEGTEFLAFSPVGPDSPTVDPVIREALSLVMPRQELIDGSFQGAAGSLRGLIPPFTWSTMEARETFDTAYERLPVDELDVERAKELVEEAAPERTDLKMAILAGNDTLLQVATALQAGASEIGLTIAIDQLQSAQFGSIFFDESISSQYDLMAASGYNETPNLISNPLLLLTPGGVLNPWHYDNPIVVEELDAARASLDPFESADHWIIAQDQWTADRAIIPIASIYSRLYLNDRLTGPPTSSTHLSTAWAAQVGAP